MSSRSMQDNFWEAIAKLLISGVMIGFVGIQVIAFFTAVLHVIGMGGDVSG